MIQPGEESPIAARSPGGNRNSLAQRCPLRGQPFASTGEGGRGSFLLTFILCVLFSPAVRAADTNWPCWRGPHQDGRSDETDIPTKWSATENVAWKVEVPGKGHSSPVVWGDKVFLTTAMEQDQKRLLLCFDRTTGKQLWERESLRAPLEKKHDLNSYASGTPATDGKHLWVTFFQQPNIVLLCYDLDGKEIWRKTLGEFHSVHGFCSSPLLYKDTVIINCDQDATAWIGAYDQTTGADRWRADRPNKTRSYCTPIVIDHKGQKQLVLTGSKSVAAYDPDTGKQIWVMDGPTEQFVASPVYAQDVLFITAGFPEHHILGINPSGTGNVTKSNILWRTIKNTSYVPSPITDGERFYVVSDQPGIATCFNAKTGKVNWTERLGSRHSASAVSAGGTIYFPDDNGTTWVLKASEKPEVIAENHLDEACFASPAISNGQIFIRTVGHLWCIGKK